MPREGRSTREWWEIAIRVLRVCSIADSGSSNCVVTTTGCITSMTAGPLRTSGSAADCGLSHGRQLQNSDDNLFVNERAIIMLHTNHFGRVSRVDIES
jgi:hypothetical protein